MKNSLIVLCTLFLFATFNGCSDNNNTTVKANAAANITNKTAATTPKATNVAKENTTAEGEGVKWMTVDEAQAANKKNPKKIFMDVYTPWCGPCKMLDRMTFNQPEVIKYMNENFYSVKFNAESADPVTFNGKQFANPGYKADIPKNRRNSPHQFSQALGVRGYPCMIIFDQNLNKAGQTMGFKDKTKLMAFFNTLK